MPDQLRGTSSIFPFSMGKTVLLREGEQPPFTPKYLARMVIYGVRVGDRDIPRVRVYRRVASIIGLWFRQVTALPDDEFPQFVRDRVLRVRRVEPRRIVCESAPGQMLAHYGGWPEPFPPADAYGPHYMVFYRKPWGWWLDG